jgi:hypothetical protein
MSDWPRVLGLGVVVALGVVSGAQAQGGGADFRLGAVGMLAQRGLGFEGQQGVAEGVLLGAELGFSLGVIDLRVRVLGGELKPRGDGSSLAAITLGDIDGRAGLRFGIVHVEGGFSRRVQQGQLSTVTFNAARVGFRIEAAAGRVPLYFAASGAYVPYLRSLNPPVSGTAVEVETAVQLRSARIPVWLMIGYRLERRSLPGLSLKQPEQLAGVLFGGGLATRRSPGGRRR